MKTYQTLKDVLERKGLDMPSLESRTKENPELAEYYLGENMFNPELYACSESESGNILLYGANINLRLDTDVLRKLLGNTYSRSVEIPIISLPIDNPNVPNWKELLGIYSSPSVHWHSNLYDDLLIAEIRGNEQGINLITALEEEVKYGVFIPDGVRENLTRLTETHMKKDSSLEGMVSDLVDIWKGQRIEYK